jgi:hypothetical protein
LGDGVSRDRREAGYSSEGGIGGSVYGGRSGGPILLCFLILFFVEGMIYLNVRQFDTNYSFTLIV